MPPLAIGPALTRLRGPVVPGGAPLTSNAEVWAIVRFDYDNRRMEVFWSERNVRGGQIKDAQGFRPYGSHAEPVFINNYSQMVADHGAPAFIEIFISRSPCADGSAASVVNGVQYPAGCGPKLRTFAAQNPGVNIQVVYDVIYEGNPGRAANDPARINARITSLAELSQWAGLQNLTASLFGRYNLVP